jgi:hypothetical protein
MVVTGDDMEFFSLGKSLLIVPNTFYVMDFVSNVLNGLSKLELKAYPIDQLELFVVKTFKFNVFKSKGHDKKIIT